MITFDKLKNLMEKRGISKEELRMAIGVSSATSSKLFKNGIVSLDVIEKICNFLNCQPEDIMEMKHENCKHQVPSYLENQEAREKKVKYYDAQRKKVREKIRIYNQTKRAENNQLKASLTAQQWENIKDIFNYKCAYCGVKMDDFHQEHVIPVSKGGVYSAENIIPACERCNSSKRDKDFFNWYPQQLFYSKEREQKILNYIKSRGGSVNERA